MAMSLDNPTPLNTEAPAGPWKMTLLQVLTGDDATAAVTSASVSNTPPSDGHTYVAAQLRVVNAGDRAYAISGNDFAVTDASRLVRRFVGAAAPEHALEKTLAPGESIDGWIVGGALSDDSNLVLLYDSLSLTGTWADQAFALSAGASIASVDAPAVTLNDVGNDSARPAAVGDTAATASWAISIANIVQGADVVGLFPESDYRTTALEGASPGSSAAWLAFQLQVTNNRTGRAPAFFSATALNIAGSDGRVIPDVSILSAPEPDASGYYLAGGSRLGWVVFELPTEGDPTLLRFLPFAPDNDPRFFSWGATVTTLDTAAPQVTVASGATIVVSEDVVNLRKEPSVTGDPVAELKRGTELQVTGEVVVGGDYSWYPVTDPSNGNVGFVAINFVEPAS